MTLSTLSGVLRGGLLVATLGALTLTGCAGTPDDTAATGGPGAAPVSGSGPGSAAASSTASAGTAVVQGTGIPADWPTGLDLPSGATLLYSTVDTDGMSLLFDAPQDLADLASFFDGSAKALGYTPESDNGFVDMLSRSWKDGTSVISVTATPIDGRTSGILMVRPAG